MQPISEGRDSPPTTAGAWLKNARQQRGLHIAALAVMLKVPQAKLEALEADRFDLLPDATFARALATAVCRALKVDPAPVLGLLPRSNEHGFDVRPGLNQPFRERGGSSAGDGGVLALLKRPAVWGLALLLVAAGAIYWIPASWLPEREATPAFPASAVASTAASGPTVEFVAAPPAASEPAASVPALATQAAAPVPTAVASAPLQVRDVAPPAAASAAGPTLRVTATADSWLEIVDSAGQTLISRVLRQGEQQDFTGAAPYKVRVGNVSGTKIEWRGSAVDLAARASNNIARLELK